MGSSARSSFFARTSTLRFRSESWSTRREAWRRSFAQARAAIIEFLRNLNDRDDVFLFAFSGQPVHAAEPSRPITAWSRAASVCCTPIGPTSLYDAVVTGLVMLQRGRYDKRALLVVTDGMDNTSGHSLDDVVALARRQGVLIYSIGIGDPNASGGSCDSAGAVQYSARVTKAMRSTSRRLRMLSTETGAKTYNIRVVGDGAALSSACARNQPRAAPAVHGRLSCA